MKIKITKNGIKYMEEMVQASQIVLLTDKRKAQNIKIQTW